AARASPSRAPACSRRRSSESPRIASSLHGRSSRRQPASVKGLPSKTNSSSAMETRVCRNCAGTSWTGNPGRRRAASSSEIGRLASAVGAGLGVGCGAALAVPLSWLHARARSGGTRKAMWIRLRMDHEGEETGILTNGRLGCKGKVGLLEGDFMARIEPSSVRTATLTLEPESPSRFPSRDERGRPWWESYFGADYSSLYPDKDLASGEAEAPRIAAALALAPGARVLDLGCGNGRHVLALARRGFDATGVDFSPTLLQMAAAARDVEGLS